MKILEQIQSILQTGQIPTNLSQTSSSQGKQERLYLEVNNQFQVFFIELDQLPFLKVYIKRPKGFDFKGIQQSGLETERCKKAKLQILNYLQKAGLEIPQVEAYEKWEDVLLSRKQNLIELL